MIPGSVHLQPLVLVFAFIMQVSYNCILFINTPAHMDREEMEAALPSSKSKMNSSWCEGLEQMTRCPILYQPLMDFNK
jgi:hypothetical protein